MSDNLKCVFQEFYRLSILPVEDCQLLLASAFPLFEKRTSEYDVKWRELMPRYRGISFGSSKRSARKGRWKATQHEKDEWTPTEIAKKNFQEKKAARYGRMNIVTSWHNSLDNGYSTPQLLRVISFAHSETYPPRHLSKQYSCIGVNVIPVTLYDGLKKNKLKLLAIMDHETAITSVHVFKRLAAKSIFNEIVFFINALEKHRIHRREIYFVNTGDSRTMVAINTAKELLKKGFPEIVPDIAKKYNFKYPHFLHFNTSRTAFETELKKFLLKYNIGESRKRSGPYLQFKYRLKNRRIKVNQKTLVSDIKRIIKLT